jgi:hypothetical protein
MENLQAETADRLHAPAYHTGSPLNRVKKIGGLPQTLDRQFKEWNSPGLPSFGFSLMALPWP